MVASSRRGKIARHTRNSIRGRNRRDVQSVEEPTGGPGLHWIFLGVSILLVAGLSFVSFGHLSSGDSPSIYFNLRGLSQKSIQNAGTLRGSPDGGTPSLSKTAIEKTESLGSAPRGAAIGQASPAASGGSVFSSVHDQGKAEVTSTLVPAVEAPPHPVQHAAGKGPGGISALRSKPQTIDSPSKKIAEGGGIAALEGASWFQLSKGVDFGEILFGAWIFLPNAPATAFPQSSMSMKTVAANKISGCKAGVPHSDGWALFVHEWGTLNQQLRLSWTDYELACNELFSETALVPFDRWVHVGFSLSEANNAARLFIDGTVIADTQWNMGSFAKASRKVSLSQANIRSRKFRRGDGAFYYGAHAPQDDDQIYVQSHAFFGFLADMRLIHVAPDSAEEAKAILTCTAEELTSKRLVPPKSIVVQLQFKAADHEQKNLVDGLRFVQEPAVGKRTGFQSWKEKPTHPWFALSNPGASAEPGLDEAFVEAIATPLSPIATLAPEALEATWPTAWTFKFSADMLKQSQLQSNAWAEEVRAAMVHTWKGYTARAWGHDDLRPISGAPKDWCRLGITILDSLSTLWLMELKGEFSQASAWLTSNPLPSPGSHGMHSVFEINIRGLGGLLGAYALSGQQVFLDNARRLGDALMKAFDTRGLPNSEIDVGTGNSKGHGWVHFAILAEVATMQVEFRYLSHALGDDKYKRAADKAFDAVLQASGGRGLIPIYLTANEPVPRFGNQKISLGAMGDSYYEYLIKQWVQTGKTQDYLKNKWKDSMREMLDQLVRKTSGGLTYICEKDNGQLRHRMDHLACFVGGMLIMGARELPPLEVDPRWEPTAVEITRTCYEMYKRSPTGLSPEYVVFHPDMHEPADMSIPQDAPHNLLRPEAAEAMYYMHYYTGNPMYRHWAHEMMQAFNRHAKVKFGYASIRDVRRMPAATRDDMESFWAAETLKYLYLIQMPRSKLNLDEYVLNTEAHPMKRWN